MRTRLHGHQPRHRVARSSAARCPSGEHERMRAPFQEGDFPGPVKYGYLNVGVVESGAAGLRGRTVFTLFPHQSAFVVPESAVDGRARGRPRPPGRAGRRGRDRGERAVGCRAPRRRPHHRRRRGHDRLRRRAPRSRHPGRRGRSSSTWTARRRRSASASASTYAHPDDAPLERDIVIDASGSEEGLQFALRGGRHRGRDHRGELVRRPRRPPPPRRGLPLAAPDDPLEPGRHGRAAPTREPQHRATGSRSRSGCCGIPAFDALLTDSSSWRDLPAVMAAVADGSSPGLCHTIDWRDAE